MIYKRSVTFSFLVLFLLCFITNTVSANTFGAQKKYHPSVTSQIVSKSTGFDDAFVQKQEGLNESPSFSQREKKLSSKNEARVLAIALQHKLSSTESSWRLKYNSTASFEERYILFRSIRI